MLVGRDAELAALGGILDEVRGGGSSALLVRGEAGVGKTALLDELARLAQDFIVIRIEGIETELQLDYAGLHRVVLPFMDRIDLLPQLQRVAIRKAFGQDTSLRVDRFLVGLAVLSLFGDPERGAPLLVTVDDAPWLDQDSLAALAFVARRLHADRVALVFAARDPLAGGSPLQGLGVLQVSCLENEPAGELLTSLVPCRMPGQVVAKVVAATGGNPLAITGLVEELTESQLSGVSALPDPLPIGELFQETFMRQINRLPEDTQIALLLAAAEPTKDRITIDRAAQELGLSLAALDPAKANRLVSTDSGIEFRHPLIRSVVYSNASPAMRRSAHLALATALQDSAEPDRWAMHWGLAALHQDEAVAAALEESAVHARSRGGFTAETSLLIHSANLTPGARERSRRFLGAAHAANLAGNAPQAKALLDLARQGDLGELDLARAQMFEGVISIPLGRSMQAPVLLLNAAKSLAPINSELSREALLASMHSMIGAFHCAEGTTGCEIGQAALIALEESRGDSVVDSLLRGVASAFVCEYPQAAQELSLALDTVEQLSSEEIIQWPYLPTVIANELWNPEAYLFVARRLEAACRELGALHPLRTALLARANYEVRDGQLVKARAYFDEFLDTTEAIGGFSIHSALLDVELVAWEGEEELARSKIRDLIESATGFGAGSGVLQGYLALTTLELGLSRYPQALETAQEFDALHAPSWSCYALPVIVEAGMRCGESKAAARALAEIEERAQTVATPYALGLMWRCRALVADDDASQASFGRAIELFERSSWSTERARTHLLYGEWLRRRNQRTDARIQLRTAYEMFDSMGARAYAGRARVELEATGERARKRSVETAGELTPQEAQVARLARDGLSNPEIAARLFISPHTVHYHLGKVFSKLGISSRNQLARALPDSAQS